MRVDNFETKGLNQLSPSLKPEDLSSGVQQLQRIAQEQEYLNYCIMSNHDRLGDANQHDPQGFLSNLLKRQTEEGSVLQEAKRQRVSGDQKGAGLMGNNSAYLQAVGMQGGQNSYLQGQGGNFGSSQSGMSSNPMMSSMMSNEHFMRAELEARRLQHEASANRNAAMLASLLGQPQNQGMSYPALPQSFQQQQPQQRFDMQQQQSQGNAGYGGPGMDTFLTGFMNRPQNANTFPPSSLAQHLGPRGNPMQQQPVNVNAVLRQLSWPGQNPQGLDSAAARMSGAGSMLPSDHQSLAGIKLPPCDEGLVPHFSQREKFPLGVDEDPNWLSEFHCFVRSELVEVCRASHDECKTRNNATSYQQVGIRCRFCAHRPATGRGCRSSAFPSSIRQIYQSFTMMLRDHFGMCEAMPEETKKRFLSLKDKPSQGATDSKRYWMYSAMKAGLADSPEGIVMNQNTVLAGMSAPPFGSETPMAWQKEASVAAPLITPADGNLGSPFLRCLLTQAQVVQLREAERIGNRRSLEQGLPGFSCRYCWEQRRLGLCRMFPARRRTLAQKIMDLQDHLRRCQVTPSDVKEQLEHYRAEASEDGLSDSGDNKALLDRVWARLGHGNN